MSICRYFLQGTCRYGNRCRYEHTYVNNHSYGGNYGGGGGGNFGGYRNSSGSGYGNNYNYGGSYVSGGGGGSSGGGSDRGGTSILRAKAENQFQQTGNSLFGQPPSHSTPYAQPPTSGFFSTSVPESKPSPVQRDIKEIMQLVINEFTLWEQSGQWPLSCISLFKESFPGLMDYSPEEIRWYMYQARATGNLEECQQLIKGIYEKAKLIKEYLITPSAEVFDILARLTRGEKLETVAAPSFPDKSGSTASIFGNASSGSIQPTPQPAASFTFTVPKESQPTATNQNFPAFGAPQTNMFSNAFNPSIFGNVPTSNANSNPNPSIFGGVSQIPQVTQTFGSVGNGILSSNLNTQNVNDSVTYTPMEEVTEEMLNSFNAPVFTMGSVPIKPPPKELCGLRS